MFKKKDINTEELNEVISLSKKLLKILYIVFIACIVLVVIVATQRLSVGKFILDFLKVVSPFFIGFIIAWLLRPLVKKLNTQIKSYSLCSLIVFVLFVSIIGLLLYIFIPTLYEEVNELVGLLPSFVEKITNSVNEIFLNFAENGLNLQEFQANILSKIYEYSSSMASDLPSTVINFIGSFISGIGTVGMGLVIGIYMLIDYDSISKTFKSLFPRHLRDDVHKLTTKISEEARKCVNGTFLVALMVLICDSVGFALVGLNAPLLFGFFCGLTDLIPFIGPYIGGAAAVVVGFTQDPLIGIGVLIIAVLVQIIENYVLQPIVMSKASSLHPVIIIIALLVFGHFFGMLGMILATPLLTIVRVIIEFTIEKINLNKTV